MRSAMMGEAVEMFDRLVTVEMATAVAVLEPAATAEDFERWGTFSDHPEGGVVFSWRGVPVLRIRIGTEWPVLVEVEKLYLKIEGRGNA